MLRALHKQLLLIVIGVACLASCESGASPPGMDTLVSPAWLEEHLHEPDLVVIDCTVAIESDGDGNFRTGSGRAGYDAGHIPGARFADLTGELADSRQDIDFAVPSPEAFAAAMGRLGVSDESRVVLYSANNASWAARVWWMLRWIGFDNAALLDGGLAAWKAHGGELTQEAPVVRVRQLSVSLRPELIVDAADVEAAIGNPDVILVDVLSPEHFRGEVAMYGRPGHIPGAINVPVFGLFDENGAFLDEPAMSPLTPEDNDRRTITYCGGGIAASASAFMLTRLGYRNVAVYTGSLQEWAADPDKPLETN